MSNQSLALAYATLILVDAKQEVTEGNLSKLTAQLKVDAALTRAFATALKGKNISSWFTVSSGSSAPVEQPKAVQKPVEQAPVKVEKVKEPEPVEEDMDMGGMFGDD